jgi:hypothetical protein
MDEKLQTLTERLGTTDPALLTLLAFVFLAVILFLILWCTNPWRIVVAWIATMGIQLDLYDFRLCLADLFVLPLIVSVAIAASKPGGKSKVLSLCALFLALFVSVGNVTVLLYTGRIPQWTYLNKDVGLIAMVGVFWAIIKLTNTRAKLQSLVCTFVVSASVLNVIGLMCFALYQSTGVGSFVLMSSGNRYVGFMVDPNGWCGYLACGLIMQLSVLLTSDFNLVPLPKGIQWANVFVLCAGCILTMSRSGVIALAAGVIGLVVFTRGGKTRFAVAGFVIAASLIGYYVMERTYTTEEYANRASDRSSIQSRMDFNRRGLQLYTSSAMTSVTGIGIGAFFDQSVAAYGVDAQIHNTPLWLLVEGGPLIFGVFLAIVLVAQKHVFEVARGRLPGKEIAVAALCAMISIVVWFAGIEGLYHRHFWLVLAICEVCYLQSGVHKQKWLRPNLLSVIGRAPSPLFGVAVRRKHDGMYL